MEIIKVIVIGFVSVIIINLIKNQRPDIGVQISIAAGVIIFMMMMPKLTLVIDAFKSISEKVNIDTVYLNTILKIIGISYLTTFGVEICKDAGQTSIAGKIEFAGKILIVILAMPILMAVMDMIIKIIP